MKLKTNDTKYGKMSYLHNDYAFTDALKHKKIFEEDLIEKYLTNIIKNSSTILDIGAHCGSHSLIYAKMNPDCKIFSYEPQKCMYDILNINLKQNNISNVLTFNFALGNKKCDAHMEDKVLDGINTNKKLNNNDKFNIGGLQIGTGGESIKIERLDDQTFPNKIDYIKIDVEGFENFVIDGGINLITKDQPIIFFEHNHKCVTAHMNGYYVPTQIDIIITLKNMNYNIKEIENQNFIATPNANS